MRGRVEAVWQPVDTPAVAWPCPGSGPAAKRARYHDRFERS